jgi:hypothetical protein
MHALLILPPASPISTIPTLCPAICARLIPLDAAVDRLYRPAVFATDRDRVEHLFGRYEALVNPLERLGATRNRQTNRRVAAEADTTVGGDRLEG